MEGSTTVAPTFIYGSNQSTKLVNTMNPKSLQLWAVSFSFHFAITCWESFVFSLSDTSMSLIWRINLSVVVCVKFNFSDKGWLFIAWTYWDEFKNKDSQYLLTPIVRNSHLHALKVEQEKSTGLFWVPSDFFINYALGWVILQLTEKICNFVQIHWI